MTEKLKCEVSPGTTLEAYIGRRDEDVFIEVVIENPLNGTASICLRHPDAHALAETLNDLAQRLEKHLNKAQDDA